MAGRFIKLYDKILNWEWYSDINTCRLFIHLLLKANYKDQTFQGTVIRRGQMATSLSALASQTCLSERQVRVSLDKLKMTGEVTSSSYPRYRVITVLNYDEYQSDGRQNVTLMTSKVSGSRQANCQAHDKQNVSQDVTKYRNIEDRTIEDRNIESPSEREGGTAKRFSPPSRDEIEIFCLENGLTIDVDRFLDYYTSNGWMVGKSHMKDWQATVRNWARRDQQQAQPKQEPVKWFDRPAARPAKQVVAQQYKQRAYDDVQAELLAEQDREMEEWMRNGGGA